MKHILFVDDEIRILQGLKRMLRHKASEWDMVFVENGKMALETLEKSPFDVIVSDMRMPEMDGATLLHKVYRLHPRVVRIVLSGHAELETTLRAVPIAHQFLSKPCDPELLSNVIERSCNLQSLLGNDSLRSMLNKVRELPSLPHIYNELTQALTNPQTSLKEIGHIVEQDAAMSAKTLQLVNSAFFSLPQRISNIQTAVSCLGINMIKILSLSVEVFRCFSAAKKINGFSLEEEQGHAFLTASIAKSLLKDRQKSEDAFMAGLLHDIGKLILADQLPENLTAILKLAQQAQITFEEAERRLYQVTHTEIGAYLLGIWGLPSPIVEAVAYHHKPQVVQQTEFDILSATYVANALAQKVTRELKENQRPSYQEIDHNYLASLGVEKHLSQWEVAARSYAEKCYRGLHV